MNENFIYRLVKTFVTTPLSPLLILTALVAGYIAVSGTPREEEPQIVVPMADVFVSFPGVSAGEVEQLVAAPLEKLLWQIDGVEHVYSVSRRDSAVVTVRFFVGEDREKALVRLQSKISANLDRVPSGVSGWVVSPVEIDDVPIVTLTLWSENQSGDYELRRAAEEMAARLEQVPDLSRSQIVGGSKREMRVELKPEALEARNISALEVFRALQGADSSLAAGSFSQLDRAIPVVSSTWLHGQAQVENLVIGASEGRPVYLKDVASVKDGPEEVKSYTRIGFGAVSGRSDQGLTYPAVSIALSKKKGTNAVGVAESILKRAEDLAREILPSDIRLEVTRNYGETANEKVNELLYEIFLAIVIVIVIITLSLGWRAGLIVAAAVPITFALTLLVNMLAGYSINRVTLFALVLSLGLVVDDPIVDVENIHRHYAKKKEPPLQALLHAIDEVRLPVIIATLAVVVSFLPMLFITGMMGPYMKPMAVNVPVSMLMSMLVAFTITPWMSYHVLAGEYGKDEKHQEDESSRYHSFYRRVMNSLLSSRTSQKRIFWGIGGLAIFAGVLVLAGGVPLKMLPYDNKSELQLVLDMPDGSTLESSNALVGEIESYLAHAPEVLNFTSYTGLSSPIDFNGLVRHYGLRQAPHLADIRVNLSGRHERSTQSHTLALMLRDPLQAIVDRYGAKLKIVELPPGPPVLSTLVAEVYGSDDTPYESLIQAADLVSTQLAGQPGVVDVDVMSESPHEHVQFILDREKAGLHGISSQDVVQTMKLGLSGMSPARVHEVNERTPLNVNLALAREDRSGEDKLGRLLVKGADGRLLPLAEMGSFIRSPQDQPVYHKDLRQVAFVLGDVAGVSPPLVVLAMHRIFSKAPLPPDISIDWSGEGEWKITKDVFRDLGIAFFIALIGIYILLVIQTHSLSMPLIIMMSIPLGVIGIFPGFWLLNLISAEQVGAYSAPVWFTATGMIGMIALAGIVVRNSIILIDFIQNAIKVGMPLREAVVESGVKRTRAILLTAATAMLGAFPITLDPIFSGLAWSLVFGLIASTAFTLLVVPLVYALFFSHAPRGIGE